MLSWNHRRCSILTGCVLALLLWTVCVYCQNADDELNDDELRDQLFTSIAKRQEQQQSENPRPAKHLVRPMWMDPRKTWASFLRNSERTDREAAKKRKRQEKKCRRLLKKIERRQREQSCPCLNKNSSNRAMRYML